MALRRVFELERIRLLAVVVLTTLVVLAETVDESKGCVIRYGRRGCYHRVLTGVLVSCNGKGKETKVPQNIPQDTVYMSLVNFKFGHLMKQNFTMFPTVECLTIMDSGVAGINSDAFSGMEGLHELVLQNTRIHHDHLKFLQHPKFNANMLTISESPSLTKVNINVTKNLQKMKTLNLNGNGIQELNGMIFPELRELERLDLSQNKLTAIAWPQLREPAKLNSLYMDGNQIQTIPESMFSVFFAVKDLTLADNPFHCNCKLRWLRDFYDVAVDKKLDFESVVCASPTNARMEEISPEDFACSQPSAPVITWLQLDSTRYELNCTSKGDPAPTLQITLPDGRIVITPPSSDLSRLETVTPQVLSSFGAVHCQAKNTEGVSTTIAALPVLGGASSLRMDTTATFVLWATFFATLILRR